jgi:YbbR domain-containing protein
MILPFLRHLFVEDFWWKVFSLGLAILIWVTVTFVSQREPGTVPRVFSDVPVTVVSSTDDVRAFKVSPSTVDVTVRGDADLLQNLRSKDIRALVDLTGVTAAGELRKPVAVSVPAGITFMGTTPREVQVVFPPDR